MTKREQTDEITKERNEIKDIMKLLDKCVSLNPMCKSEVASVLYGNNYRKAEEVRKETAKEIDGLRAENARLTEKLKQVLLAVDTVKEMSAMCDIDEQNAEIERLKDDYAKLQELFAQYQMANDKEIKAQIKQAKIDVLNELKAKSYVNDYCREVVEVEKIDQMIKELIK